MRVFLNFLILFMAVQSVWSQTYLQPQLLRDINPTMNPFFTDLKKVGHQVFFFASDSAYNNTFWASDGTAEGTREVKEINPGPNADWWTVQHDISTSIIGMRDTAYFFAYRNDIGYELWKSAGHDSNTVLVKDINPGPGSALPVSDAAARTQPTLFQDKLYFVAFRPDLGYEVWRTDGTEAGTIPISSIPGNGSYLHPVFLQVVDNRLFFAVDTWGTTEPGAFFASDGTPEGTVQFSDLIPAHYTPSGSLNFVKVGSWIYFTARETGNGNDELYRVSDDLSQVELFYDFNGDNEGSPGNFSMVDGGFVLNARHNSFGDASNITLLCDGTININQSLLNANGSVMEVGGGIIAWNNLVMLEAGNDSIYVTDGTVNGLRNLGLVGEINGLNATGLETSFLEYGERLIFVFSDTNNVDFLMMTDGTPQGTFPLLDPDEWDLTNDMVLLGDTLIISLRPAQGSSFNIDLYALNLNDIPLFDASQDEFKPATMVFPNPNAGEFYLSNCASGTRVELRNITGSLVGVYTSGDQGHIQMEAAPEAGTYLVQWFDAKTARPQFAKLMLAR